MTAERDENEYDGDEYGGMDALMAAILDEPLPEAARADAGFMAEHRVATAEVALLREQLGIIGEALSAPPAPEPVTRARPARRRRPALRVLAYGTLATAVIAGMVTGLAWLGAHNGGASADSSSAQSKSDAPAKMSGDGLPPSDPEEALACDRLVVEGTVAEVETHLDDPWSRIVLTVIRSYKPAKGPSQVSFLLDGGADPKPRKGQHVLVEVGRGQQNASLWAVGDTRVAVNRAWILKALPGSRTTTCPAD
ncbi:hypothetical protein [Streptomyces sp. NBC_00986]|uniref:hypothetical protein n=1 Tax=Streptomyces sp. NBC_00986 TaxID=2903702 RepID=UPI003866B7CB|nr:hypothetical protein OG504_34365 [Streptomyces sp. NBC_00986]